MHRRTGDRQEEEEQDVGADDDGADDGPARTKKNKAASFVCYNCFFRFSCLPALENHVKSCYQRDGQFVHYPYEGQTVRFEKGAAKAQKVPFMLFYDFECLQKPAAKPCSCPDDVLEYTHADEGLRRDLEMDNEMRTSWEGCRRKKLRVCPHKTQVLNEQVPFAYHVIAVDREGGVVATREYVGEDAGARFCDDILDLDAHLTDILDQVVPMALTREDWVKIKRASSCYLCDRPLGQDRVRDHDHLNGRFLGMAHNKCNLYRRQNKQIVAFSHNFRGYDCNAFIKELHKKADRLHSFSALPVSSQKFRCLYVNNTVFLDSFDFLADSLANLVNTLTVSKHDFALLRQLERRADKAELLTRKGVYPYSFATSLERLSETRELPPIEHFASDLGGGDCSPEDYDYAGKVFSDFGCRTMMDYTLLYLRTDVYLLAEVVSNLRGMIFTDFEIDICHYLSLPMLTKDLMLKHTGVEIDLISDPEMSDLMQYNIRGGVSFINTRLAEKTEDLAISYLDANNLYGKAMSFPLPLKDFSWMTRAEIDEMKRDWRSLITDRDDSRGYILEVTLRYPKHLHVPHNSFPLAPQHLDITQDMLSPYASDCLREISGKTKHKSRKLTGTFYDRERYVLHALNLKLYLELGLELVEIHRGVSFLQRAFVAPYIAMCALRRAQALTKSMKDCYKLLCNALFGKFIENVMNRLECCFNMSAREAVIRNSNPLLTGFKVVEEDLSISYLRKAEIKMKQMWAVGFSILELSKYVMQSAYYNHVVPALPRGVSVLMSDTDSWVLAARAGSSDEVIGKLGADFMDCSNYDADHEHFSTANKAVPGKFKNEIPRDEILRFVGVRAKSYAFDTRKGEEDARKCKGVAKAFVKKLTFDDYLKCIESKTSLVVDQTQLRAADHTNRMIRTRRQAFTSFDDKRYLLCPVHSAPYGSRLVEEHIRTGGDCFFCKNPEHLS